MQNRAERARKTQEKANSAEGVAAVKKKWVKTIIMVEEDCEASWGDKKKLHKDNQRALIKVRQQIKKMVAGEYKVPASFPFPPVWLFRVGASTPAHSVP